MTRFLKIRVRLPEGFDAVLPCCAATVAPDPDLCRRDHPLPPPADQLVLAQAGTPWQQALLVLAYLREGETFAELAAGFGVGTATAVDMSPRRWLAGCRSPKVSKALRDGQQAGYA